MITSSFIYFGYFSSQSEFNESDIGASTIAIGALLNRGWSC